MNKCNIGIDLLVSVVAELISHEFFENTYLQETPEKRFILHKIGLATFWKYLTLFPFPFTLHPFFQIHPGTFEKNAYLQKRNVFLLGISLPFARKNLSLFLLCAILSSKKLSQ